MMFAIAQVALARVHASSRYVDSRLSYPMQPEHADMKFVQHCSTHICWVLDTVASNGSSERPLKVYLRQPAGLECSSTTID